MAGRSRLVTVAGVFLSHYRRNPFQLIGLILIVTVAMMLWSGVSTLTGQARTSLERSQAAIEPVLEIVRTDGAAVDQTDFAALRRAGVCATPRLTVKLVAQPPLRLIGVDPLSAGCLQSTSAGRPADDLATGMLEPRLWGNAETFERWQELAQPSLELPAVTLVTDPALPADTLAGDIAMAAHYRERGRSELQLLTSTESPLLPSSYRTLVRDYGIASDPLAESFLLNLNALGMLALLVATLLIRSVFVFGLSQREETLSVMRQYGVTRATIVTALASELIVIGAIGGSLGLLLGGDIARLFSDGVRATLAGLFSAETQAFVAPSPGDWAQSALILLLVIFWACGDQLWRPGTPPERSLATPLVTVTAALAVALAGATLIATGSALWQVYAGIGLSLGGLALCLPRLMVSALGLWQRYTRDPLLEWSLSEMRGLARSMALPLIALAFAIAATIGVYTMVTSFEATFARWLDQRLQGDLYLTPEDDPATPAVIELKSWTERLKSREQVTGIHPVVRGEGLVGQAPVDVVAVDPTSPLLQEWDFIDAVSLPWVALEEGRGMLVNEQLARRADIAVGDHLEVIIGNRALELPVLAVYADYGRPAGEVLVALAAVDETLPGWSLSFALSMESAEPGHREALFDAADLAPFSRLRDQHEIKQLAEAAFSQTFAITRALSGLTLALSGIAMALIGYTTFRVRRPLYALVHVFGLSLRQVRIRLVAHAAGLALLLATLAVPLGVFLAWVLVARVNPLAFGWALPFDLYPGFWLFIVCVSGLLGATVGVLMGNPVRLEQLQRGATVFTCALVFALVLAGCGPADSPDQSTGFASLGSGRGNFTQPRPGVPIEIPEDMGSHPDYRIEWWYLTANLEAEDGTEFGVQWTLFRQSLTPPSERGNEEEGKNEWDTDEVWMAHAALSSPEEHHFTEKLARGGTGQAGVEIEPFRAWLDDWQMVESDDERAFEVRASTEDFRYRLDLNHSGQTVKHGDEGFSAKSPSGQGSMYFSFPDLQVSGQIETAGVTYQVRGQGWFDREWSSQLLQSSQRGWDWFLVHFEDGSKLMVFQLRSDEPFFSGTLVGADGAVTPLAHDRIGLVTAGTRETEHGLIPEEWRLRIRSSQIDLQIRSWPGDHWNHGSFPYWEGPITVSGSHAGRGFVEMTGYPTH